MEKVLVAMSGGVDSSTTATILCEQGFEVVGATLKLYEHPKALGVISDIGLAQEIAVSLGIEHHVLDFRAPFAKEVINKFVNDYFEGKTPNPCVYCNRCIKFGKLLDFASSIDCDKLATGHYAKVEYDSVSERYLLKKASDKHKDQSYVLYPLVQKQLSRLMFPMENMTKDRVRVLAKEKGLPNHQKPESQDICFVKKMSYSEFIKSYSGKGSLPGKLVGTNGEELGTHNGIINYTIGQRKGLGASFGAPKYVVAKLAKENVVVLGAESELYSNSLVAGMTNFIPFDRLNSAMKVKAKVRYNQDPESAMIYPLEDCKVRVEFATKQRAVTPGQHVVFYEDEFVVGGGMIL
ncbi:tRNA-specific 2-thiouridylase MnmA 1 [Clostridia bacterium]|nr:tRNA-specific 2-thiouridylase MnmA 1 [Clostridia bacterium]